MERLDQWEHVESIDGGCNAGNHLWDDKEGNIGIETDGNLTKIKVKCLRCGKQTDISSPLDLNRFLGQSQDNVPQPSSTQPTFANDQDSTNNRHYEASSELGAEILKKLLG